MPPKPLSIGGGKKKKNQKHHRRSSRLAEYSPEFIYETRFVKQLAISIGCDPTSISTPTPGPGEFGSVRQY
jgi:hypothetical protein